MDWILRNKWAKRRHSKKSGSWIKTKYCGKLCPGRDDEWVFGDVEACKKGNLFYIEKHAWTPIKRHKLVPLLYSPDDASKDWYWKERLMKQEQEGMKRRFSAGKNQIARNYGYKCPWCGEHYSSESWSDLEIHHIKPRSEGGKSTYANMVYLHGDCHRAITALGASNPDVINKIKSGRTYKYKKKAKRTKAKRGESWYELVNRMPEEEAWERIEEYEKQIEEVLKGERDIPKRFKGIKTWNQKQKIWIEETIEEATEKYIQRTKRLD